MIGKTVGKYRILDRLGRGGMGTVYRAVDETLDREVAIKVLNPDLGDPEVLKRFRAEAVALARLNHSGIATIYELYRHDDDLLMVMELVRGETVQGLAERLGPLAVPQAVHLCMQVLDGLVHAHRAGVVHRDLKPANLMVTDTSAVKIMDFGIARVLGAEHFTHAGYMMGTPAYMSPEQVLGHEIDGRADLYAVGVVLYRLLAGELPFRADTSMAMVQKQIAEPPTPISTFRPDLPAWCAALIERALAKAPADRFQTAEEFRAALASAVKPESISDLPTMATPEPPDLPTRNLAVRDLTTRRVTDAEASRSDTPVRTDRTPATVVLGRTHLVSLTALLLVLTFGIAVLAYTVFRRGQTPQQIQSPATPSTSGATEPASDRKAEAIPVPPGPRAASNPPSGAPALPPPPAPAPSSSGKRPVAPPAAVTPQVQTPRAEGSRSGGPPAPPPDADGGRATVAPTPIEPAPTAARTLPIEPATPLIVNGVYLAIYEGRGPARERSGVLRLGDGQLAVLESPGGTPIVSVPYTSIVAAFVSRGRQPKLRRPDGSDAGLRVDVGRMGFVKERNWVTIVVRQQPVVVIRLEDGTVRTVMMGLNARSGIPAQFIQR